MPDLLTSIHVTSLFGVFVLLVIWVILFKCAHLLVMLLRGDPLIGWSIGPFGVTLMSVHKPSTFFTWFDVFCPAFVSIGTLYVGLSTSLSPVALPSNPLVKMLVIAIGVVVTSAKDVFSVFHDARHPLWGEARILRCIQWQHASWAKIHFTPFGNSYVNDHFCSSPTDLLQTF
ncbi:MAG TPA: hypothetical protein VHZ51_20375 [Ktedonobacteraceae bacterium]|jgi:hypothetical protein|nr:hypothetical protein [Ktedonobacteraceae bacterium]